MDGVREGANSYVSSVADLPLLLLRLEGDSYWFEDHVQDNGVLVTMVMLVQVLPHGCVVG